MGSSFSIRHPLEVSQASDTEQGASERARGPGVEGARRRDSGTRCNEEGRDTRGIRRETTHGMI